MKSKLRDIWTPKRPTRDKLRNYKSLVNPQIQMTIGTDGVEAKVEFLFIDRNFIPQVKVGFGEQDHILDFNFPEKAKVKRIISGPTELVYVLASRQASQNSLSQERAFNRDWNRTL